ncbi:MAG: hypothetical protein M1378_11660 [Bacteroidetes bacterium]|nr:hypothetical protein [Bacteroidota bacterium]
MEIKNSGISAPSIGIGANMNNTPRVRKVERFKPKGYVLIGEEPIERSQSTYVNDQGELIDETIITGGVCVACGSVFKDTDVAMCTECHYFLCRACADKYRCVKCGKQICPCVKYYEKPTSGPLCRICSIMFSEPQDNSYKDS